MSKPTILLADDHPGFPEMVEQLLGPNFEVVGKVTDGQSLFEAAIKLKPDVIVTDISMPVLDGISTADRLKESGCTSRIVFLTVHSDPDFVRACLAAGAFGYVTKSRIHTELVTAIRDALSGQLFISHHLTPLKGGGALQGPLDTSQPREPRTGLCNDGQVPTEPPLKTGGS